MQVRITALAVGLAAMLVVVPTTAAAEQAVQVSAGRDGSYEASLAAHAGGFVVAWHDTRHDAPDIYLRRLDTGGYPVGPERRLTANDERAYEPSVGVLPGGATEEPSVVVAWYEVAPDGSGSRVHLGAWSGDGQPRWIHVVSSAGRSGRVPFVAVGRHAVHCVWLEHDGEAGTSEPAEVWWQRFDHDGAPLTPPRLVAPASRDTWNLNGGLDPDDAPRIVFDARVGTAAKEIFLVQAGTASHDVVRLTPDDGVASTYPDLSLSRERAAVAWFDTRHGNEEVFFWVGSSAALRAGAVDLEVGARRVTTTDGASIGAYLAWNGATFGLAWCDEGGGGPAEVFVQQFDPTGAALGSPVRMTDNRTASLIPAIGPAGSGFALAWNEDVVERRGDHVSGGRSDVMFALVPYSAAASRK